MGTDNALLKQVLRHRLEIADTFEACIALSEQSKRFAAIRLDALKKALTFTTKCTQVNKVLNVTQEHSALTVNAHQKMDEILQTELDTADTFERKLYVFRLAYDNRPNADVTKTVFTATLEAASSFNDYLCLAHTVPTCKKNTVHAKAIECAGNFKDNLEITLALWARWANNQHTDSRLYKRALKKTLSHAKSTDECLKIHEISLNHVSMRSPSLKRALEFANNLQELGKILSIARNDGNQSVKSAVIEQIDLILAKKLNNADTVETCDNVRRKAPKGSGIQAEATLKIRRLILDRLCIARISDLSAIDHLCRFYAHGDDIVKTALLEKQLEFAATHDELISIATRALEGSKLQKKAARKAGALLVKMSTEASTLPELWAVHGKLGDNWAEKAAIFLKIQTLLDGQLSEADTPDACWEVYLKSPTATHTKDAALKKYLSFI